MCGPGSEVPAYLATSSASSSSTSDEIKECASLASPLNTHIENSTRARGIALYCTLVCVGHDGYAKIILKNIEWARSLVTWLEDSEDWDVLTPPRKRDKEEEGEEFQVMNIVLFAPSEDRIARSKSTAQEFTSNMITDINDTKEMYVSPTVWKGRPAVRLAVSNWMTDEDDLERVKSVLRVIVVREQKRPKV